MWAVSLHYTVIFQHLIVIPVPVLSRYKVLTLGVLARSCGSFLSVLLEKWKCSLLAALYMTEIVWLLVIFDWCLYLTICAHITSLCKTWFLLLIVKRSDFLNFAFFFFIFLLLSFVVSPPLITVSACLIIRRGKRGEYKAGCGWGGKSGARRRPELPDQQCCHPFASWLSRCHGRHAHGNLPHQHSSSANDQQGNVCVGVSVFLLNGDFFNVSAFIVGHLWVQITGKTSKIGCTNSTFTSYHLEFR